ncbi:MAG: helix-turn-helix domain-containing protein [Patescibacteria group bacterium]|nr:helix-turn-helix domain-containing protein [Patescibacteria group bacterium]
MQEVILIAKNDFEQLLKDVQEIKTMLYEKVTEQDEIMNVQEVAKLLNLNESAIYHKVCYKQIPYMKQGKKLLFSKKELMEWLKSSRAKTLNELENETNDYDKKRRVNYEI